MFFQGGSKVCSCLIRKTTFIVKNNHDSCHVSISDFTIRIVISAHIADTVIHLRCLRDKILKFLFFSWYLCVTQGYTCMKMFGNTCCKNF